MTRLALDTSSRTSVALTHVLCAKQWQIAPEMVLPVVVLVVLFIAVLISYPWHLLTFGSIIYLLSLPFGWSSYRAHERRAREAESASEPGHVTPSAPEFSVAPEPAEGERPPRLN